MRYHGELWDIQKKVLTETKPVCRNFTSRRKQMFIFNDYFRGLSQKLPNGDPPLDLGSTYVYLPLQEVEHLRS